MLSADIMTAVQEDYKLIIVLMDNHGFKSIGALSRSAGQTGFGTRFVYPKDNVLPSDEDGDNVTNLPVDLAMNARSLGADVIKCETYDDFTAALQKAKEATNTTVVHIQNDRYAGISEYESWWDVPVAEVSEMENVQSTRKEWEKMRAKERYYL
jgi:3D-(3,5/4)-trihydroxycyclohexane-1,2-dione acylhydrolase (decyclizing)